MSCASSRNLGLPKTSAEAFVLLAAAGLLDMHLAVDMKGVVGFRNIVVHDYRAIYWVILRSIIE